MHDQDVDRAIGNFRVAERGTTREADANGSMSRSDAAMHLQRLAGNRAMGSLLPVQRDDDLDALDSTNRGGGLVDQGNAIGGAVTSGSNLPNYRDPDVSTGQATVGGVTTPAIGIVTGGIGLGFSSKRHHEARTALKSQTAGTVGHKAAKRDVDSTGGDVAEKTLGTASGITSTVAGGMAAGGSSTASIAGAVAAPLTLPLSVLQSVRWGRKAHGARIRCDKLNALIKSEDAKIDPNTRLKALEENVTALETQKDELTAAVAGAQQDIADARKALRPLKKLTNPSRRDRMKIAQLELAVQSAQDLAQRLQDDIDASAANLSAAVLQRDQVRTAREAMEKAVKEESAIVASGKTEQVSLRMIQAYALKKNQRGLVKKIINTIGSLIGAGAGVAGTIAAIAIAAGATAGASILMATPVGWALGGAAALIGLGMAGYSAWKFFSKRWKRTDSMKDAAGQKLGFGARLGKTLAFWQKTGPSRRDVFADKLYDLAKDDAGPNKGKAEEARETIKALGLDWVATDMASDKTSAVKLIAAKMGS